MQNSTTVLYLWSLSSVTYCSKNYKNWPSDRGLSMESSHLCDNPEPNMRHLAHVSLYRLSRMLTDMDHSVCHDPSLFSQYKESGKWSRLALRHSPPRMGPPLLNHTTGSSSSVLFEGKKNKIKNSQWHPLAPFDVNCMLLHSLGRVWGDAYSFFMQEYILGIHLGISCSTKVCCLLYDKS